MRPPRIGINSSTEPKEARIFVRHTYLEAMRTTGGRPLLIPTHAASTALEKLDFVDGLLLTGGPEVHPPARPNQSCIRAATQPPLIATRPNSPWSPRRPFIRSTIRSDSASAGIRARLEVNSLHHQGNKALAAGLRATAFAPDDLIEAADGRPIFGVQWHPEDLYTFMPEQAEIFWRFMKLYLESLD